MTIDQFMRGSPDRNIIASPSAQIQKNIGDVQVFGISLQSGEC